MAKSNTVKTWSTTTTSAKEQQNGLERVGKNPYCTHEHRLPIREAIADREKNRKSLAGGDVSGGGGGRGGGGSKSEGGSGGSKMVSADSK